MNNRNIFDRISPLWIGLGISGSLIILLLLTETVLGRWDALLAGREFDALINFSDRFLRDIRLAIVLCLVIGYLPAAFLHVMRSARHTVVALQGALDCTREECEWLASSIRLSVPGLVITGLIGVVMAFAAPYMVPPVEPEPWNPLAWSPEVAWHRVLLPIILVWQWWLIYAVVIISLQMSRVAKRLRPIDLFDLTPLTPFTQLGLTNALILIGLLSIWSLMMLETGFGGIMILIGAITLVVTGLALRTAVGGVHARIRQSKDRELAWINEAISNQRMALKTSDAGRSRGEMADLVAYQSLVERVPEWPFTTSTYTRLALYLLIPVASWGLGFAVELMLDGAQS